MRALFLSLAALFVCSTALAKDALKLELIPKAQRGQGQPELVVHAQTQLKKVSLSVTRSVDGKRIKLDAGPIAAGREHRFSLEMSKAGEASFQGTLAVVTGSGEKGEMPLDLKAELLDPIEVSVRPEDVELAKHAVVFSASREVKKAEVSVLSDTGTPLGSGASEVESVQDGKYRAGWEQSKGTVLRISIKAIDADGFFGGVDLFPWRVDIPHEEVNFKSGSFEVDASESAKLEQSFKLTEEAIAKYGKLATIRLFIAGHTDTVGSKDSNIVLSNNRARAIGRWFRKRGVKIPILTAGFGEELLLVQTPDETDEVKNRRAEYIVAVDPPPMKGGARFLPLE
jgi:outer membrane protein OmpA-like peptidoglycan-associated protein